MPQTLTIQPCRVLSPDDWERLMEFQGEPLYQGTRPGTQPVQQPSSEGCCVTADDRLMVEGNSSIDDFRLGVFWAGKRTDGSAVRGNRVLTFPGDRSLQRNFIQVPAGCICSLSLVDLDFAACLGQSWAKAQLVSGGDSDWQPNQVLAMGHVSTQCGPRYPLAQTESPLSGPGHNVQYNVDDPAVSTNFSYDGDATVLWRIKEVRFVLTTSAVAANRMARVFITNWLGQQTSLLATQVQAASLVRSYIFQPALTTVSPGGNLIFGNIPPDTVFAGTGTIASNIINLQAGDQISSIRLAVEEYLYLC